MECPFPIKLWSQGIEVPCGQCAVCKSNLSNAWKTRLRITQAASSSAYFVTLTYSPDYLPHDEKGNPCFCKEHLQKFNKLLRAYLHRGSFIYRNEVFRIKQDIPLVDRKFKYFISSEYGASGEGHRPHYHAIYFDLPDDLWTTQLLVEKCWKYGFTDVSCLTDSRISYTVEYSLDFALHHFAPADWMKPIRLSSIGLGSQILTQDAGRVDWMRKSPHNRVYLSYHGEKLPLGRYLKDKVFDDDMKARISDTYKELHSIIDASMSPEEKTRRTLSYFAFEDAKRRSLVRRKKHI